MIPNLPPFFDMIYSKQDGRLAPDGFLYNDQLAQTLNIILQLMNTMVASSLTTTNGLTVTNQGLLAPNFTAAQITALAPTAALGTIWFNTDTGRLNYIYSAGLVSVITSVP